MSNCEWCELPTDRPHMDRNACIAALKRKLAEAERECAEIQTDLRHEKLVCALAFRDAEKAEREQERLKRERDAFFELYEEHKEKWRAARVWAGAWKKVARRYQSEPRTYRMRRIAEANFVLCAKLNSENANLKRENTKLRGALEELAPFARSLLAEVEKRGEVT
ncbi:MAG: hypothetical protein WCF84_02410 [Anaerolineae bacterium]